MYNPNSNIQATQNIEEFGEDIAEGFFDDDEMIEEDSTQKEGTQSSQKENIYTRNHNAKELKQKSGESINRGFIDETIKTSAATTPRNFDQGSWNSTDEKMSISGDIHVDIGTLPTTKNEKGENVLRMYWLDAYEDPFKQPGTVYLFGKVWVESASAFASCCLSVQNICRNVFLLKRNTRVKKIKSSEDDENEDVSIADVYKEFNEKIAPRYNIQEHKSKPRQMKYAFEYVDVPNEADYLQVMYSAKFPALPSDVSGETFSRIFGANQSSLEHLLLSSRIKGPSWLEIKDPSSSSPPTSWCKFEAKCVKPQNITVMPSSTCKEAKLPSSPPLTLMALNMKTIINPKTHQNEVAIISGLVHTAFYLDKPAPKPLCQSGFCAIARPSDAVWPFDFEKVLKLHHQNPKNPKIDKQDTERSLLGFLYAKIGKFDPDIIIGHDVSSFDIEVLLHRAVANKIPQWSRFGRLKRQQPPWLSGNKRMTERTATTGRLVCDLKISAKELTRCKSYDLAALSEKLLGKASMNREVIDDDKMRKAYSTSNDLLQVARIGLNDVTDVLQCVYKLNALPLALQITQIAGNVMSRTLLGGRAERNEYLLLHAFQEKDYIVPDKQYGKSKKAGKSADNDNDDQLVHDENGGRKAGGATGRKKPAYAGGLVLEPKKGFYDKFILLMDFNSLYPSIIQEYNICFTTVSREKAPEKSSDKDDNDFIPDLPPSNCEAGILPTEIRKLVERRREVKKLLKDTNLTEEKRMQYDIRQLGLKLTANSMYGCLGFSFSRFYAKPLAALVTSRGRDILLQTKELVEKMNLEVIYGDTDSIMINSNSLDYSDVFKLGAKIKAEVNKMYKLLELEVDGVFRYMLLLKKKKYAAVTVEKSPVTGELVDTTELKGLDIVRRDWSSLASNTGKEILTYILSGLAADERISKIHDKLEVLANALNSGKISLSDLAIIKQLTKDPEDYPDKKSLPHVQVALRMNSKGGAKKLKAGDTVAYIICDDGSNLAATQRAYHIEEVRHNSKAISDVSEDKNDENKAKNHLKIDIHYYLAQQLHPVISRLCDPLEGTDSARIAQCLGLDPEQFRKHIYSNDTRSEETIGSRDEDRFRSCTKFQMLACAECEEGTGDSKPILLDSPVRNSGKDAYFAFTRCSNPTCKSNPLDFIEAILNKVTLNIRDHIKQYYQGWIVCEDPGCSGRTRQLPLSFQRAFPICETCRKATMYTEYTASQLYLQLLYYQNLFDVQRTMDRTSGDEKIALNRSLTVMSRNRNNSIPSLAVQGEQVHSSEKYRVLKECVDKIIQQNNYPVVSLNKVFDGYFGVKAKDRFCSGGLDSYTQTQHTLGK